MSLHCSSVYLILVIIFYSSTTLINSQYSPPTKIKCRKDMYSRLSILGAMSPFIPTTQECYGCLYAIQDNDVYHKTCLGQEIEFGYRNFSDFVKIACQREFKCYTCYKDDCNVPSNTNEMIPVPTFSSTNSFKCYHGEREASQFRLMECFSSKRCVIVHNFEQRYWATTCDTSAYISLNSTFPAIKNLTNVDYYYCNTSECNYDAMKLNGTTQAVPTWMKDEYLNGLTSNLKINQSIISTHSMINHYDSLENTRFTVIGKALPNATMFKLGVKNYGNLAPLKLKFNIKKKFISLEVPASPPREYRRKFDVNLNQSIEITFNSSKLLINGTQYFNYTTSLRSVESLVYGGEWEILASYKVDNKTGKNETFISKKSETYSPPITYCGRQLSPSDKKVMYFQKPFSSNQTLFISTKSSTTGVISLRLQASPCADYGEIPLHLTLAWTSPSSLTSSSYYNTYPSTSEEQFQRANVTRISPKLANNIIPNNPKLSTWTRYISTWSEGNVTSFYSPFYNGPRDLRIQFRNNSLVIVDYLEPMMPVQTVLVKYNLTIRYLIATDPFSVIKDITVGNIN